MNASASEAGLRTASIWGVVPSYLSAIPNPKVTLGILRRVEGLLALSLQLGELETLARQFDGQVADSMAKNPQLAEYVRQIEERGRAERARATQAEPNEPPSSTNVVEDVEEFLRRLRRERNGE